jgi:MFS family permease
MPDFSAVRATLRGNFAAFTVANAVSLIGTWMQRIAVGWLTWKLTASGTWLGAVSMAELLPVMFLAPITGVLADRFDRRLIATVGQALAGVQAAALAVLTLSGTITAPVIFALQLVSGVIQPMMQTARLVLVPTLVPRQNMGTAVAITSLMFNLARIVGPALSGVLITTIGAGWSFAANAISYIGVVAVLALMKVPPREAVTAARAGMWADMRDALDYTRRHPILRWMMPMILIMATLNWPLGDLMAGIADANFHRGAAGLAALVSAQGIGAICGGLFLAQHRRYDELHWLLPRAMAVSGALMAMFASLDNFHVAVAIIALNGAFNVVVGAGSQTVTQTVAEEHLRGRTLSIWYTVTRAGPAVGGLALGTLASHFGFHLPIIATGLITAAAGLYFVWRTHRPHVNVNPGTPV